MLALAYPERVARQRGGPGRFLLRNGRGATSIGAYCVRAKPAAAISVPLRWDELGAELDPDQFTPEAVIRRVAKLKRDPWDGFWTSRQSITRAMRAAVGMKP